jgi:signal peptidase I
MGIEINFPLVLVILVFATGAIWLLDIIWLAPRRKQLAMAEGVGEEREGSEPEKEYQAPAWVEYSRSFFPVLALVLVLRSFLYEPFQIPSGSMLPTLKVGDFILVNKFTYGIRLPVIGTKVISLNDPQRGDVLVFKYPNDPSINYIKRVVGLPGDRIRYVQKQLYVNGELVPQQLIARLPPSQPKIQLLEEVLGGVKHEIYRDYTPARAGKEWVVPEGHYFVMGDNRDNSNDSRVWGYVPDEMVVGKAQLVWMHWNKFWSLPSFANVGAID